VILAWAPLPGGRAWGSTAGVDVGPDGHIWAYDRCGATALEGGCDANPTLDPIFKFDRSSGKVLASFGAGLFVTPHGIHVDAQGNVWVTDFQANAAGTKGHQAIKFSPEGQVLMRLGTAGKPGSAPGQLNQPTDVIPAAMGDILVADGHSGLGDLPAAAGLTGRIVKFDSTGKYLTEWGKIGTGPGDFRTPHALAFDSRGRLFVADRGNHRIQIFDQDGKHLESYHQFGRISGLFITADDTLYAIDSESTVSNHAGWKTGVRVGRTSEDRVTGFIPPHANADRPQGVAGEGVAVDAEGTVYAAEGPGSRATAGSGITKYARR
jgi:DNA-binding beta-propeller fold protein YncE